MFNSLTLYSRILLLITFIIFASVLSAYILIYSTSGNFVAQRIESESVTIANSLSTAPLITENMEKIKERSNINAFIIAMGKATTANIVIYDMDGNIVSSYITNIKEEKNFFERARKIAFFENKSNYSYIDNDLRSSDYYSSQIVRKIFNEDKNQIGIVVVADRPSKLESELAAENMFLLFIANAVGLIVGIAGATILVKDVKDTLFGMEPEEVAKIVQERNTMLNSVQEGIVCIDRNGDSTLINSSAQKILEYSGIKIENIKNVGDIFNNYTNGLFNDRTSLINHEEKINSVTVITNQVVIIIENEVAGAVITFRLKTELEKLAQQLTGVKNYADALRAQTHEFMNKIHVILGLVKMESYDELKGYIKDIATTSRDKAQYISSRLKDPVISGFIIGKISRAHELGINFTLSEESYIPEPIAQGEIDRFIIIVGNLLNNAFDALKNYDGDKIVLLTILAFDDDLIITVEDSGPGMSKEIEEKIFKKGFSTKGDNRGVGLHLVKQAVEELDGSMEIDSVVDDGTIFTVKIPYIKNQQLN